MNGERAPAGKRGIAHQAYVGEPNRSMHYFTTSKVAPGHRLVTYVASMGRPNVIGPQVGTQRLLRDVGLITARAGKLRRAWSRRLIYFS